MDDLDDPTSGAPAPDLAPGGPLRVTPLVAAPPSPALEAVVTVPVRNEASHVPRLLASLLRQRGPDGGPLDPGRFETILLFDRCTDESAALAGAFARRHPALRVHGVVAAGGDRCRHVGDARRLLMDEAARRLWALDRADGVVLATDADGEVAPDWLMCNLAEIRAGADAVGGQVLLRPGDLAALDPALRRRYLLDHAYQRLACILEGLIAPDPHDPLPRHHQHSGASLAVSVRAYRRAGGMPALASGEDAAFYRAVRRSGGRFRHSIQVRVFTSGRLNGRAGDGLAGTLARWGAAPEAVMVESAGAIEARLLARVRRTGAGAGAGPPLEELGAAVRGLRARVLRYRALASRSSR